MERKEAVVSFDPLVATPDDPEMVRLRTDEIVTQNANGVWFLSRFDDVLAATKNIATFNASFREPGVVVPDEEQFINEIPEPRHGQIRRIINGAIATHKLGGVEPFCTALCHQLLDDLLARDGVVDLVGSYVMPVPTSVIANLLGAPQEDFEKWAAWSDEVVQGTYPTKYRNERGEGLAGRPSRSSPPTSTSRSRSGGRSRATTSCRCSSTWRSTAAGSPMSKRARSSCSSSSPGTRPPVTSSATSSGRSRPPTASCEQLRDDRELVNTAIEESLRLDPPIQFLMRTCTAARRRARCADLPARQGRVRDRVGEPRRDDVRGARRVPSRS